MSEEKIEIMVFPNSSFVEKIEIISKDTIRVFYTSGKYQNFYTEDSDIIKKLKKEIKSLNKAMQPREISLEEKKEKIRQFFGD